MIISLWSQKSANRRGDNTNWQQTIRNATIRQQRMRKGNVLVALWRVYDIFSSLEWTEFCSHCDALSAIAHLIADRDSFVSREVDRMSRKCAHYCHVMFARLRIRFHVVFADAMILLSPINSPSKNRHEEMHYATNYELSTCEKLQLDVVNFHRSCVRTK